MLPSGIMKFYSLLSSAADCQVQVQQETVSVCEEEQKEFICI